MSVKRDFEAAVKAHLLSLAPLLDAELATVLESGLPEATELLLIEYDSPHFSEDFSVSIWPMSRTGQPLAQRHRLLAGKAVAVPPGLYDDDRYEGIDPWSTASKLLERWFLARWKKTPNSRAYPAVIGHHDSYFKTDLKTGKSINWDDVLKSLLPRKSACSRQRRAAKRAASGSRAVRRTQTSCLQLRERPVIG